METNVLHGGLVYTLVDERAYLEERLKHAEGMVYVARVPGKDIVVEISPEELRKERGGRVD